jgi:hypothetical protein
MPKIGSQTIEATLRQAQLPYPIHRFHYLSRASTKTLRRGLSSPKPDPAWKEDARRQLDAITEISRAIRLRRLLSLCGFKFPKLEIITGVRELIGLVLASIFENYLYFAPSLEAMTLEACREALLHPKTFKALRDWFDLELKTFVGIDVYKTVFPVEQGFAVYENRFARVLLYRFEFLPQLPSVLTNFLGRKVPELVNCNVGAAKQYGEQYQHAREHLRLPPDFVAQLYQCKMMRHFYSGAELGRWNAKWTGVALPVH